MSLEVNNTCLNTQTVSKKSITEIFGHELEHHIPYATLAVACAFMLLSLIYVLSSGFFLSLAPVQECAHDCHHDCAQKGLDIIFHCFHFIHILFAASGAMVTFYRYSKNIWLGVLVGTLSSSFFCTISDILLPYVAGSLLGVSMQLHICFYSECSNILPFLFIGVLNGLIVSRWKEEHAGSHSLSLHFFHTFIGAMAAIFYAIGHGLAQYYLFYGMFFVLMLIAVVVPCILSDVVVPIACARIVKKS